jgi:hypothetical protein
MAGDFGHRHDLAELVNMIGQSSSDPDIGVKQFQVLDADPLADRAKQLSVAAMEPDFSSCQIQVTHAALSPAVSTVGFASASMANWFNAFMRLYLDPDLAGIVINNLIVNFYSTKGKVRCYGEFGYRRFPLVKVCLPLKNFITVRLPDVHSIYSALKNNTFRDVYSKLFFEN